LGYSSVACSSTYNLCIDATAGSQPISFSVIDKYTLTVNVPSSITTTLDGVPQGGGNLVVQLSPGTHAISVPDIVQLDSNSRIKFSSWSDGSTQLTRIFDLESDAQITANYITQYRLTLLTSEGVATGDEWTDSGSTAKFAVSASISMNGTIGLLGGKYDFQGWYERTSLITLHNNGSILMNSPHTLTAKWSANYTQPALIFGLIMGAIIGVASAALYTKGNRETKPRRKRVRKKQSKADITEDTSPPPIPESAEAAVASDTDVTVVRKEPTASQVTPTEIRPELPKTTMYCSQCGAVISRDSKFCKECGTKL
jgi:hypothetical protein